MGADPDLGGGAGPMAADIRRRRRQPVIPRASDPPCRLRLRHRRNIRLFPGEHGLRRTKSVSPRTAGVPGRRAPAPNASSRRLHKAGLDGFARFLFPTSLSGAHAPEGVGLMRTLIARPPRTADGRAVGAIDTHTKLFDLHSVVPAKFCGRARAQTVLLVTP